MSCRGDGHGLAPVKEYRMNARQHVTIYTDGACIGNPGRGGYGVVMLFGDRRKELSRGYRLTTNNRMELMAAIAGLQALKYPCDVTLITDSQYLHNGIERGWAKRWRANGWRTSTGKPALNSDLWQTLLDLCEVHRVSFQWVRGHTGNAENERCDRLSVAAAKGTDLAIDEVYEHPELYPPEGSLLAPS